MNLSPDDLVALASDATDAFRRRLAEALRERGEARGEFIQVQCGLAKGGVGVDKGALATREAHLLAEHEAHWLADLGLVPGQAVFARGFVDRVDLDVGRAREVYARLVAREPVRQLNFEVDFTGSETELSALLAELREVGVASSLEQLVIDRKKYWDVIGSDVLEVRRQGRWISGLSLEVDDVTRPDSGLDLLSIALASTDAARLDTLEFEITGRGPNSSEALIQTLERAGRPSLRALTLRFASRNGRERIRWLEHASLERLLAPYPRLQTLVLPMAELHAERLEHLELRELRLHWLGLIPCGPSDLSQWQKSPVPKGSGLQFLRAARLPKLERLGIDFQYDWYTGWTEEDLLPLFDMEGVPLLRYLELRNCPFGETLCRGLVRAKAFQQLEVLDLTGTTLTDDGAHVLANHRDGFPRLERLVCGYEGLSADAWNTLVRHYPVEVPP